MGFYDEFASLDMTSEFNDFIDGDELSVGHGQQIILRRIQDIYCPCFNKSTGSPDSRCPYCAGEGFQWYETIENAYIARNFGSVLGATTIASMQNTLAPTGAIDDQRVIAYVKTSVWPDYERKMIPTQHLYDKLYELKVDSYGNPVYYNAAPIRTTKWKIQSVTPHHSDRGMIAYFELGMIREAV